MTKKMKLQFVQQNHQTQAVNAVVGVFKGQPLAKSDFALVHENTSVDYIADGTIANRLLLSDEQLLSNVQEVQASNNIPKSKKLIASKSKNGKETFCPLNFSIEMETGTGKTYAFIKTMYELNKQYGFKKFVVVVPSVAIREGTMKNLEVTKSHFDEEYSNTPFVSTLYDSSRLNELRHFAQSDALSVLVINIDSFTKDSNKINQQGERAFAPIEYIKATNPIVIVDEPQNFETDIRQKALMELNPLCTLRYSATHRDSYNLLYSLNPVQAYEDGLVKQIEVDGVVADDDHNQAFIELLKIESTPSGMRAKVRIDVNEKSGVKRRIRTLKLDDDLYEKSNRREVYRDGYILNEFLSKEEIQFSRPVVLSVGETQGAPTDDTMKFQIERTIAAHFMKARRLNKQGIKVLSLFFIDKVANYRAYDGDNNPLPGKFAHWFEEIFEKYAERYPDIIPFPAPEVHDGYFSSDRKGRGDAAKTIWKDSSGETLDDSSTYTKIMKDKERLLSLDEPLQFIFSHSALREGWDNPNVFQICTLNETLSALKKRQEIGRGLRLCVNQEGERVRDKDINVLTVIPNESYKVFAQTLQREIEEETQVSFKGRIQDARAKARIRQKNLDPEEQALFQKIWNKINFQTRYSVRLDTPELIRASVDTLTDFHQYPKVQRPKLRSRKARFHIDEEGVHSQELASGEMDAIHPDTAVPDVYAYIQNRIHLSRSTIYTILEQSNRLDELLINPQVFLDTVVTALRRTLQNLLVQGIEYHEINGRRYEMTLFEEETDRYLSNIYPSKNDFTHTPLEKTLLQASPIDVENDLVQEAYNCVVVDSQPERQFAHDCTLDPRVKFFFKLPNQFRINTPLGSYNPDWAVVFENDERVYFVAETKSSLIEDARRTAENLKIECGRKHFELARAQGVEYKVVTELSELVR